MYCAVIPQLEGQLGWEEGIGQGAERPSWHQWVRYTSTCRSTIAVDLLLVALVEQRIGEEQDRRWRQRLGELR
jgi:hypothetical protein